MDISVIIAAYNEEKYIHRPLSSLLQQDFSGDWEIVVVNDCSSARTAKVVEEFQKKNTKIRLINMDKRSGVAVASNAGAREAKGNIIAFLDADCEVTNKWLNIIYKCMLKGLQQW